MKEYIEKLYDEVCELMERPVSLGRAEEIGVYADTICALEKLHKPETFDKEKATKWAQHMKNADGTVGAHWTMAQTDAVAESMNIPHDIPRWAWGVTMNMMYSDYYDVAMKYGINRPEFYGELAKAFLMDKDAPAPTVKLMEYYENIANKNAN